MRIGGVIANRSRETDQIDRFNDAIGLRRLAHVPDSDAVRLSRLKKATLFEMGDTPELDRIRKEYLELAEGLLGNAAPCDATPMKDRDIFDFLGFE